MYTRRSRKNSKRQKTLGGKGNCQGQLPPSTTYSFSLLSPRRDRATYRLQQSKDHREVTRRNCFIATTKSSSTTTSGVKIRRKVIHDMCTFLSLFLSLLFTLSVSLSLWMASIEFVKRVSREHRSTHWVREEEREWIRTGGREDEIVSEK